MAGGAPSALPGEKEKSQRRGMPPQIEPQVLEDSTSALQTSAL